MAKRIFTNIGKAIAFFFLGLTNITLWLLGKVFQKPKVTRWGANEILVEWAAEIGKRQHRLL